MDYIHIFCQGETLNANSELNNKSKHDYSDIYRITWPKSHSRHLKAVSHHITDFGLYFRNNNSFLTPTE